MKQWRPSSAESRNRGRFERTSLAIVVGLLAALIFPASALASTNILTLESNQVSYVEQAEPVRIASSVSFNATSFGAGFIRVELPSSTSTEVLTLASVSSLVETQTTSGVITVFQDEIYVGKGAGAAAEKIGAVSQTENGQAGKALKVTFIAAAFQNSDFENGGTGTTNIDGWTIVQNRVIGGSTLIAGQAFPTLTGFSNHSCNPKPAGDGIAIGGTISYNQTGVTQTISGDGVSRGSQNLKLRVQVSNNVSGVYVVRGPYAFSDTFSAAANQQISFDWRAVGVSDRSVVFGALLRVSGSGPTWTELVNTSVAPGSGGTGWATEAVPVPADGTYRFVFVGGGYNSDCGSAATGELYIDNVTVQSNVSNDSIKQVIQAIEYANSADNPPSSRQINLVAQTEAGTQITPASPIQVNITQVDDPPSPPSNITRTLINSLASGETFADLTGTLVASDPDDDAIAYGITGGQATSKTLGGVTYDVSKSADIGTLLIESSTGKYLFEPDDPFVDAVSAPTQETFEVTSTATGVVVTSSLTVRAVYDMKAGAPGIESIASSLSADSKSIRYQVEFDEFVDGFSAADITLTGTSGTVGTWTKSEPELIGGTTKYEFTVSNTAPINGTVDFTLNTSGIQDFASPANNLASNTVANTDSSLVTIDQMPLQVLGAVPDLNSDPGVVFPNYTLNAHGDTLYGVRLSVTDAAGNYVPGDFLRFTNDTGMGNIATATSTNGVLRLSSAANSATAAEWQAAIRAVEFSTSEAAEIARTVTIHIEPRANYLADTGHFYQMVTSPNYTWKNWQQSVDQAATYAYRGIPGYLANITSVEEQNFLKLISVDKGFWLGMTDINLANTWSFATGPEAGEIFFIGDGSSGESVNGYYENWDSGEPNGTSQYAMFMTDGSWDDLDDAAQNSGAYEVSVLMVEFGGQLTAEELGLAVSSSLIVDASQPSVVSVSSDNEDGLYVRGETIEIAIRFSEQVTVTGTPELTIETGSTDRQAGYVSGSGTHTLMFSYTVQAGDTSSALAYTTINALSLNGGSIQDAANNPSALTLPVTGSSQSLDGSSNFQVDGDRLKISLTRTSVSVSGTAVNWELTGTDALDCTSISSTEGVDFLFTGVTSIGTITSSNGGKTCTIPGTSSVLPARFGSADIALSSSFEVLDSLGNPHSQISISSTSILVVVPPAASAKGEVEVSSSPGSLPAQIERRLNQALLPGVTPAALTSLLGIGVTSPDQSAPKKLVQVDHSGVTSTAELLRSRAKVMAVAGDAVSFEFTLDPAVAADKFVASYIKVGSSWVHAGTSNFANGSVLTNELTFTQEGIYEIRGFAVSQGTQIVTQTLMPRFGFGSWFQPVAQTLSIPEASLPISSQSFEVVLEVTGSVATLAPPPPAPPAAPIFSPPFVPAPLPTPTPAPLPTPTPAPTPIAPETTPAPTPTPTPQVSAQAEPSPSPDPEPSELATPTPSPEPIDSEEPETTPEQSTAAGSDPGAGNPVPAGPADGVVAVFDALAEFFNIEIPALGEPVANAAIGASGDDSVIVEFDPLGTPEAVAATTNLVAASVAILGAAAAAAAAVGAASAAGAASSAASSTSASSSSSSGTTETNNDATDAIAEAGFDVDAFSGTPPGKGDTLPLWSMAWLTFLDRPTRASTISTHRFSPLFSKLINDGIYLRASLGSFSIIPFVASIVLAILGLQENAGILLHPPVLIFMAIALIGIFDSMAGAVGIAVFVLGSLPLVDIQSATDWRMLAGTMVAGFGPIVLGRSIRNFRRRSVTGLDGLLARLGDIAFVGLMGGWVAGLAFRALPALTGLTVPAANYVATFQFYATVAIVVRILLEDGTGRLFPKRMDELSPDDLEPVSKIQVAISLPMKFFFFVFIASSFMGLGFSVWLAASIFIAPSLVKLVSHKLPNSPVLWRWLPVGLPGLAAILGLEILMNALLTPIIGDRDDYGVIFTLFLLGMISLFGVLGSFGREGLEGEVRLFERPSLRWVARIGAVVIFVLLVQFTSML